MEAVQNLPPHQQQAFMKEMEILQVKDSLTMYNNVVMRCFDGCVYNFRSKTLDTTEVKCTEQCAERYIKLTQRVGLRFAEHQALQQKRMEDNMQLVAAATTTTTK